MTKYCFKNNIRSVRPSVGAATLYRYVRIYFNWRIPNG